MSLSLSIPPPPAVYLLVGSLPLLVISESVSRSHTGTALFKMLSSVAFLSGPLFLTSGEWSSTRSLITAGLLFSLAGDFFLIPSRSEFHNANSNPQQEKKISVSFQLGVVAFAAAHIAYILAFFQDNEVISWGTFTTTFLATMAVAKWLGVIYPPPDSSAASNVLDLALPADMKPLVLVYATIISVMFATAASTTPVDVSSRWQYQRVFGAAMFVASDVYVAKDAFKKSPGSRGWIQSAWLVASGTALAQADSSFEPANFNVTAALNDDRSVASIGPGNLWGQVYKALEPYGLAVVGGRESSLGVGGFVTGGGIAFHSNLYGLALDNVESFEIVTASGRIVTASANHFSDLYWALRGGGNNLGLVTKFNLYTIPSSTMRGTTRAIEQARLPEVVSAFVSVARGATSDGNAQQYVAFARMQGVTVASAELSYALNTTDPPIFKPYRDIPALADITESRSLVEYAEYINGQNPDGHREMYWTVAAQLDESFARWAAEYFFEVMPQAANISGGNPVIIYQALTEPMLANMTKFGGNALGLDTSQGPLILFNMAFWWDNAADDNAVYAFIYDYFKVITEEAKKRGIAHQYIYMNYGSQFQDVIAGYGADSKARLQKVAATYDPRGVYQTLQPGYFKLNGAPVQY
ncbi:hypothetical protein APSETT444_003446 [Aspergillus pseudonomiae]